MGIENNFEQGQGMKKQELATLMQLLSKNFSVEDIKAAFMVIENSNNEKPVKTTLEAKELSPEEFFVEELENMLLKVEEENNNDDNKTKNSLNRKILQLVDYNLNRLEMPGTSEERMQTLVEIHQLSIDASKDSVSFEEYKAKFIKIIEKNKEMLAHAEA